VAVLALAQRVLGLLAFGDVEEAGDEAVETPASS